jgi:hypothetical protein
MASGWASISVAWAGATMAAGQEIATQTGRVTGRVTAAAMAAGMVAGKRTAYFAVPKRYATALVHAMPKVYLAPEAPPPRSKLPEKTPPGPEGRSKHPICYGNDDGSLVHLVP